MTPNSFGSLCDDFYLDLYVNTELELPTDRDTILTFFERIRKRFPMMGSFYRREKNEYCLEEDRDVGQYRWVVLEADRVGSGVVNPAELEMAYQQHRFILELMPYMLSISALDIDSLDVTFAMDFDCAGNHDEVISEALFASSAFGTLADGPSVRPIVFSPAIVIALSEDCHIQARCSVESKTSVFEPRKRQHYEGDPISLSFTVRQYPPTVGRFDPVEAFDRLCRIGEEWMAERVIPNIVKPLSEKIAQKRLS